MAKNKKDLIDFSPVKRPDYDNPSLSPYLDVFDGIDEHNEKLYLALPLVRLIEQQGLHEISTHTYSHYYCLEKGQTLADFKADIKAAITIAKERGLDTKSIIFPRNQFNSTYLDVLKNMGITSYRGNETSWYYKAANNEKNDLFKRLIRFTDRYLNVSGNNTYNLFEMAREEPFNIPSSRFLSPYSSKLKVLDGLRLKRILNGMTYAAKHKEVYHLWWHPHNFGMNTKENLAFLDKILNHYSFLNKTYDFESITMTGLSEQLKALKNNALV